MFTDSIKHPEIIHPDDIDPKKTYINQTNDVWVRHNKGDNSLELWFNGKFQESYSMSKEPENLAKFMVIMMRTCIEIGKKERSKEIKALIG